MQRSHKLVHLYGRSVKDWASFVVARTLSLRTVCHNIFVYITSFPTFRRSDIHGLFLVHVITEKECGVVRWMTIFVALVYIVRLPLQVSFFSARVPAQ